MVRTTKRLLLRDFEADDWRAVLAYQSDPRYLRYSPWTERTDDDAREFVQDRLDEQAAKPRWKWQLAIVLPTTEQLIGNCGLRLDAPRAPTGNIGYEIDPRHWGQGYATEAAREMVRLGFEEMGLEHIWAWCIADNVASVRVLEKLGMQLEERQFAQEWFKERWWGHVRYGLRYPRMS